MENKIDIKVDQPQSFLSLPEKVMNSNNGWGEYKMLVLKQLEFLSNQITDIARVLSRIDKEQGNYSTIIKSNIDNENIIDRLNVDAGLLVLLKEKIESLEKYFVSSNHSLDKRLETMNEFRESLKDQTKNYFTRQEHELYVQSVEKDLRMLRESKATFEGKASERSVVFTMVVAIIGIVLSFASLLHTFVDAADRKQSSATIVQPIK